MAPHLSRVTSPALDDPNGIAQEVQDVTADRRGPALQQRLEMGEKRLVRLLVQRAPFGRDSDAEAPTVGWMIGALDQPLLFELVDDARHRAEPYVQMGRELPHRAGTLKV